MNNVKRYTLITGGTTGIGYELARVFAENGHNVIIAARDQAELMNAAEKLRAFGTDIQTVQTDLSHPERPFELYDQVRARHLVVDILVNNAAQGEYGEFSDTDIWRELSIIQLNIGAVVILTKMFLQDMLERGGGKILNVSSIASKSPGPLQSVYHGTKAFVQSFTEAVRNEVKDKGVVVTALLPGPTDTDFFNKAHMQDAKVVKEGKLADPAKVARDGFDALMRGDDMVVSGFKNKVQVAMSNMLPDSMVAGQVHKQQAPVEKK